MRRPWLFVSPVLASGLAAYLIKQENVPPQAAFMAGILVLAALLWSTEALPLFATAILIVVLQTILLANPGGWPGLGFSSGASPTFREVFSWAADPVLMLFFGGFLLARAANKTGLDQAMSALLLRRFGGRPIWVMMGLMGVTALFSMWMSNTAATAMMIALLLPLLAKIPAGDPLRKAFVLAVPFAANIGGIGTPIGSPPNAVALGFLKKAGYSLDFLEWMLVACPFMIGMLAFAWLVLGIFFKIIHRHTPLELPPRPVSRAGWLVVVVFSITALLWMTDALHGLPAAAVALLPILALSAGGVLDAGDLKSLDWDVLILIGGGIALGAGVQKSGLDQLIAQWIPVSGANIYLLASLLVLTTMTFSNFMSNTAAANLLLPIGISVGMALGKETGGAALQMAISVALAASLSMLLPISTPPNAIAYSQGEFSKKQMSSLGGLIGLAGGVLIVLFCGAILRFWNIGA